MRDFAEVRANGVISGSVAAQALDMLNVDAEGFDYMDRKLLLAIIDKFTGGPVGLDNLAAAIGEERETIEDVIEPFLIQQGFIQRTPRGRDAACLPALRARARSISFPPVIKRAASAALVISRF